MHLVISTKVYEIHCVFVFVCVHTCVCVCVCVRERERERASKEGRKIQNDVFSCSMYISIPTFQCNLSVIFTNENVGNI